jgi:type III restriction enzyme
MEQATMKLKFDSELGYQRAAIDAVVDCFRGQPLAESSLSLTLRDAGLGLSERGFGNRLALQPDQLLGNLHEVQERNGIVKTPEFAGWNLAVEMETGTGKTYVYLRSLFELNRAYGFKKFIVVVPSVAIRAGVLHSIDTMREHFRGVYDGVAFDHFVYDSNQLGRLRSFATANTVQIMVLNIQAFIRDVKEGEDEKKANWMYRETEKLSGQKPIDFLRDMHPVVVLDEPQKLDSEAARKAVLQLNPLCTLRYSATYESPQKIYRLGPIEALDQKLVKRIEVLSVVSDDNVNDAFVRLLSVDQRGRKAKVELNFGTGANVKLKKVTVKPGDDLWAKSGERQEYKTNYTVQMISFAHGDEYLELSGGQRIKLGQAIGALDEAVMREQVLQTIKEHFDKERRLKPLGVKVLSLFFIDRVANYRCYNDDGKTWTLGKIGKWIEEGIVLELARAVNRGLVTDPIEKLHDGYFSIDKKGSYRDTNGDTREDDDTYARIMEKKEELLSFRDPLRFIVSHSALREGWDNPNVFQICTLNETKSVNRKRQEIGRGLRLPVNQEGERIRDDKINRLTVIANESYKAFAAALQTEYEEDCGIKFGFVPREAFSRLLIEREGIRVSLGQVGSAALFDHLRAQGYLDSAGHLSPKYNPSNPQFELSLRPEEEGLRPQILDALNSYLFQGRVGDRSKRATGPVTMRKQVLLDPEFKDLWCKVSQRTRYRVRFDTDELVAIAVARLKAAPRVEPLRLEIARTDIVVAKSGIVASPETSYAVKYVDAPQYVPDILAYLQNETELTRRTLARILIESDRCEELRVNPQAFVTLATECVNRALNELVLSGIEYEKVADLFWEMRRLEEDAEKEITRYLDRLYTVKNQEKTPFEEVEFASEVERKFASDLDHNDRVKFFVKLPAWFKVETPIGSYNPDWAILLRDEPKLYLVTETKGTLDNDRLRDSERNKIFCGKKHFDAIGVTFDIAVELRDVFQQALAARTQFTGIDEPQTIESFLTEMTHLKHTPRKALRLLFAFVDRLILKQDFATCDRLLEQLEPSDFDVTTATGFLAITLQARSVLAARAAYASKVEVWLKQQRPDDFGGLLAGLL